MIYGNKYYQYNILENDIEISSEDIQSLSEYFNSLDLNNIILEAANGPEKSKSILKDIFGSNGFSKIDREVKKTANEIGSLFKSDGVNKTTKKKAKTIVGKFYEAVNLIPKQLGENYENQLRKFYGKIYKEKDIEKFGKFQKAYYAFAGFTLVDFLISAILSIILGQVASIILCSYIIEPILLNICLQSAIRGGYDKDFNAIRTIFSVSITIIGTKSIGYGIISAAQIGIEFIIQKITSSEKVLNALKIKKESDKEIIKNIGTIVSSVISIVFKINAVKVIEPKLVVDTNSNSKNPSDLIVKTTTGTKKNATFKDKAEFVKTAFDYAYKNKSKIKDFKK